MSRRYGTGPNQGPVPVARPRSRNGTARMRLDCAATVAIAVVVALGVALESWPRADADAFGQLAPLAQAPPGNRITREKILLGKALFWDEQLSSTRTIACGSCHRPEAGGADPRAIAGSARATHLGHDGQAVSMDDVVGSPGVPLQAVSEELSRHFGMEAQVTRRRAPSVINAALMRVLPTDGRIPDCLVDPLSGDTVLSEFASLERQVLEPISSPIEMGGTPDGWRSVTERLERAVPLALAGRLPPDLRRHVAGRDYPELFRRAFGSRQITPSRIAMAIASYERTLVSNQSPLDSVLAGAATLREEEAAGRRLFGSLGCTTCHSGPLLSDQAFHFIGLRSGMSDSGRAGVTSRPEDFGAFRTPSLRNVSLRRVFMHGGQLRALEDVVTFYYRGGCFNDAALTRPAALGEVTIHEVRALTAFLGRPLVDPRVAAGRPPFDRPLLYTESGLRPEVLHEEASIAGSSSNAPMPVADEPPLLGTPDFTVSVLGALGSAKATLIVSSEDLGLRLPNPSATELYRREIRLAGNGASGGFGSVDLQLPSDSRLAGRVLQARWYVCDPGAPGGVAVSPPVRFRLFAPHWRGASTSTPRRARVPRLYPARYPKDASTPVVRFDLFESDSVEVLVEDSPGHKIRRLEPRALRGPGDFVVSWDARDSTLTPVERGRYYVRVVGQRSSARIAVEAGK